MTVRVDQSKERGRSEYEMGAIRRQFHCLNTFLTLPIASITSRTNKDNTLREGKHMDRIKHKNKLWTQVFAKVTQARTTLDMGQGTTLDTGPRTTLDTGPRTTLEKETEIKLKHKIKSKIGGKGEC